MCVSAYVSACVSVTAATWSRRQKRIRIRTPQRTPHRINGHSLSYFLLRDFRRVRIRIRIRISGHAALQSVSFFVGKDLRMRKVVPSSRGLVIVNRNTWIVFTNTREQNSGKTGK